MRLADFSYRLPLALIAQTPIEPRSSARLLIYKQKKDTIEHKYIYNLPDYLRSGDVLVINDSKVFPARLLGQKAINGAKAEVFLLRAQTANNRCWSILLKMNHPRLGDKIIFAKDFNCQLKKNNGDGTWLAVFNVTGKTIWRKINCYGQTPLPPYIKQTKDNKKIRKRYQTVYADKVGSVAAPTAGLHLTQELLRQIKKQGIKIVKITLHVGLGTFMPIKTEKIKDHKMHAEWASINSIAAKHINQAKANGNRVVAVGTTSVRVLESWADKQGQVSVKSGWLNNYIYPPYKFKCVDAMLTNFHIPRSSLLLLVSAFIGRLRLLKLYRIAIKKKYRFYSFGDAVLLVKK
jgi:S-adenosylmethionine:tRNA ribosyltransferase-isomerase